MADSIQNFSYKDAWELLLYGNQMQRKIAQTFATVVTDNLRFTREEPSENEHPYISLTPTSNCNCQSSWNLNNFFYDTYNCSNTEFKCIANSVDFDDYEEIVASIQPNGSTSNNKYSIDFRSNNENVVGARPNGTISDFGIALYGRLPNTSTATLIQSASWSNYSCPTHDITVVSDGYSYDTACDISSLFSFEGLHQNNGCVPICKSNIKVFVDNESAIAYLEDGTTDGLLEDSEEEEEEPETASAHKYYRVQEFRYNDLGMTSLHDIVTKSVEVTFTDYPVGVSSPVATGITTTEPICVYVSSTGVSGNASFIVHNGFGTYMENCTVKIGNTTTNNVSLASLMGLNNFSYGIVESTNPHYYIKTVVSTNMVIYGASGNILNDVPIDSDDMLGNTNSADYDCGLSECWLIDKNAMKNIAQTFNTTIKRGTNNSSAYVMGEWIVGLSAYSNPLDVVCDLFYMPIDLTDYCNTTTTSFSLIPPSTEEE